MTKYLRSDPFSANSGDMKKYRNNWEATFGKKEKKESEKKDQTEIKTSSE